MSQSFCPECGCQLKKLTKCVCGWKAPEMQLKNNRACAHYENGNRCRFIGTRSFSRLGNSVWYCGAHWQQLNDIENHLKTSNDPRMNESSSTFSRQNWRDVIFPDELTIKKK